MEHVNHPKRDAVSHPVHYNSHPNGIECIDIIRHYVCDIANAIKYLWRAGLKVPSKQVQCDACIDIAEREETRPIGQTEMGKDDAEKEIEDLKKALWYIEDYKEHLKLTMQKLTQTTTIEVRVKQTTGYHIQEITKGLDNSIATSLQCLLRNGLIWNGKELCHELWFDDIDEATKSIQQRIADIKNNVKN